MPVITQYTVINSACELDVMYHELEMNYPKFFKMDELCKAALLGSEQVLRSAGMADEVPKMDMSLVLFNRSSSIDSDYRYLETVSDDSYFPSPALFTYTLANIMTGQICLKYKIFGESSLYVSERFEPADFRQKVLWGLQENCLCGWVDCYKGRHEVMMMLVQRNGMGQTFDVNTINKIHNQL